MSMTGFSAGFGGAEGVDEVLESSPANIAAAIRKIKEKAENRRINTSKKCSACIAGRTASLSDWKFSDGVRDAMIMLIIKRVHTLLSSSMAEHSAVNRRVVGSSPT